MLELRLERCGLVGLGRDRILEPASAFSPAALPIRDATSDSVEPSAH